MNIKKTKILEMEENRENLIIKNKEIGAEKETTWQQIGNKYLLKGKNRKI